MGRWTQYDEDSYRLPEGMKRIGYDADTQRYTFKDEEGSIWVGAEGAEFSEMTKISSGHRESMDDDRDIDEEPQLPTRSDGYLPLPVPATVASAGKHTNPYRLLYPFFVVIGVFLLIIWRMALSPNLDGPNTKYACAEGTDVYFASRGDSCWAISQRSSTANGKGIAFEEFMKMNPMLECEPLRVGAKVCVPSVVTVVHDLAK